MVKNPPVNTGDQGSIPVLGRFPWRKKWQLTPVFLPEKSHGQRSVAGYSPWGCTESDMTERLNSTRTVYLSFCVINIPGASLLAAHISAANIFTT